MAHPPPHRIPKPSSVSEIDLCVWLGTATPGDRLEYHRGFLAVDIEEKNKRLSERDSLALKHLRHRALALFERDLVHLVQERLGPGHFAYIAIARPKSSQVAAPLSMHLLEDVA
ncbi:hypothetical protein [Amaricoccus macauensis]|uniref:hypothetical protein n=1 Tax=Amaricoccus macauensis TaxID=57001 RepID=UPI003C7E72DF